MHYDLAIIGSGWAGLNACFRAKELGLKTCLIEKENIGGTCLNQGCIPTKALIQSAKVYALSKKSRSFGIENTEPKIVFSEIQQRKDTIVRQLHSGLDFLLKGMDIFKASARIIAQDTIEAGPRQIKAGAILIACGSKPLELKNLKFDGKKIISSNELLNIKEVPRSLLIIGGGVIGCEFAGLFASLGSNVSVVELMPQLLPGLDREVAGKLEVIFKKKGIKVNTQTDASILDLNNYDLVLLAIGRVPDTKGLSLEEAGIKTEKDRIITDDYLRTSIPGVYAAGDCTARFMLAHFAAYQGRIAAENIPLPGAHRKADNANVPNCIFTDPEIANIGPTEEDCRNKGIEPRINRFDFLRSGMARILNETEGFIKIISDNKTGRVLGASIIGPRATELIGIFTLAAQNNLTVSQIQETIFAHPTLSEGITEAFR